MRCSTYHPANSSGSIHFRRAVRVTEGVPCNAATMQTKCISEKKALNELSFYVTVNPWNC